MKKQKDVKQLIERMEDAKDKIVFKYTIFQDGVLVGKTQVTVNCNANSYSEAEEKLYERLSCIERINHAGKTITISSF